jgi:hypothetical protein
MLRPQLLRPGAPASRASAVLALLLIGPAALALPADAPTRSTPTVVARVTVAAEPGRFMAWPANNGLWRWDGGRELLVGYHDGPWQDQQGHKVGHPEIQRLARSRDGGRTWRQETPSPYVGREGPARPLSVPLRFDDPNLAIRVVADGRAGDQERLGRFFVSGDRGHRWQGPFRFEGLGNAPALRHLILTSRTAVRITGPRSAQFLLSARDPRLRRFSKSLDKTFVVETDDGGLRFRFVSWVVPWSDPYRAVMPSLVDLGNGRLVVALRRRDPRAPENTPNWIDAYASDDGGLRWRFLSRVGQSGGYNGNPAALARLPDGRLAVAYANRSQRTMVLRLSEDDGRSWGPPLGLHANPFDYDMGYPQMTVNERGELVVIYYLASADRPHSRIEASLVRL